MSHTDATQSPMYLSTTPPHALAEAPRRARLDLPTLPSQCRLAMSGGSFVGGARVHSPQNIPVAIPRRQFVVITRLLGSGGHCSKAWKDGAIPSPHLVPLPEGEETLEQILGARRREQSLPTASLIAFVA